MHKKHGEPFASFIKRNYAMNYIRIDGLHSGDYKKCSMNGTGIRVVLWCSGCDLHCKGCHNSEWWDFNVGKPFDEEAMGLLMRELSDPLVDGLTLLGGEPTARQNIGKEIEVAREVKASFPNKTIWLYSGRKKDELMEDEKSKELLSYCDVLVDGRFVEEKRNIMLKFRGSSNQTIWEKDKDGNFVESGLNS